MIVKVNRSATAPKPETAVCKDPVTESLHSEPIFSLLSLPKRYFSRFKIHRRAVLYWRI